MSTVPLLWETANIRRCGWAPPLPFEGTAQERAERAEAIVAYLLRGLPADQVEIAVEHLHSDCRIAYAYNPLRQVVLVVVKRP